MCQCKEDDDEAGRAREQKEKQTLSIILQTANDVERSRFGEALQRETFVFVKRAVQM